MMDENMSFVHLHTHSEYSPLDGLSKIAEIAEQVKKNGQNAFAITDHGTCAGHPQLQKVADSFGLKPIFGIEAYFVNDRIVRPLPRPAVKEFATKREHEIAVEKQKEQQKELQHGYQHLILLAQNQIGLQNIWAMSTEGYREGFYYRPRIDWDTLERHSEGVIVSTACLRGPLSVPILAGDEDTTRANLARLLNIFDDRLYLEIHSNQLEKQFVVNKALVGLSREFKVPLVAVVDSHYPTHEHKQAHDVWIACQTNKDVNDERELFGEDLHAYLQTEEEVRNNLSYLDQDAVDEAIANTQRIADMCEAKMVTKKTTPTYSKVGGTDRDAERLVDMCLESWEKKTEGKRESQEIYIQRFEREAKLLIDKNFCGYFLMVADYCRWAKEQGILVGPGRGSGGGSLVAYLMGITGIDPVESDLLFERFLTEGRTSLPDFDVDFPASKKAELLSYVSSRYGEDHVVTVGTHLRLKSKGVVKDVARALKSTLPSNYFPDIEAFSKFVEEAERGTAGLGLPWDELWSVHETELSVYRQKYPELFDMSDALVGRLKTYGKHAAGVVISTEEPLTGTLPLRNGDDENGQMVAEWDMEALEEQGLIKFDLLTLRSLDTLQETIDLIKENHGEIINFDKWGAKEYDNSDVWEMISAGQTKGLFQIETTLGTQYSKKMRPCNLAELADLITLVRPGPMNSGLTDLYLKRRDGDIPVEFPDPRLAQVLSKTYGALIYQEDIMQTCMILANYDSNEADGVRKILGKKKVDEVEVAGKEFVSRAVENGMNKVQAEALWSQMAEFAKYSFNRAHAYGYAILAYWCAWLKYNYPIEFLSGVFSTVDKTRIPEFVKEAQKLGIDVLPPDINQSKSGFRAIGNSVLYGIDSVKGIGPAAVENIVKNQPYFSWEDFEERSGANSAVGFLLAKIGAFDALVPNRRALVKMLEDKKAGLDKRCISKSDVLNEHNLPCSFDWASEPVPVNPRNGKVLKPKAPPKRCSLACRNYTAPDLILAEDLSNYSKVEIRHIEEELLGIYLTSTPFEVFDPEHRAVLRDAAEKAQMAFTGSFVVGGILSRVSFTKTSKGDPMAFCTLDTESDSVDFAIFPGNFRQYQQYLTKGELFVVEIKKTEKGATMQSLMPLKIEEQYAAS